MKRAWFFISLLPFLLFFCLPVFGQELTPTAIATPPRTGRVWTVAEILNEKRRDRPKKPISYCDGARFKPCVCFSDVAREMQYRPAVAECNGKAGIALTGKYGRIFSAVVRDRDNRDRFPVAGSGYGGCTFEEANAVNPPNSCSAFKAQQVLRIGSGNDQGRLHCLGESGYSSIFSRVSRVTVKLADSPNSSDDPIVRWCLRRPDRPLN
jgi:hypothetical protein